MTIIDLSVDLIHFLSALSDFFGLLLLVHNLSVFDCPLTLVDHDVRHFEGVAILSVIFSLFNFPRLE